MSLADLFHQLSTLIGLPAVVIAGIAAAAIVVARDWRLGIFSYGVLVVMLATLLSQAVPTEWALLQAIVGGLVGVMLYLSARQLRGPAQRRSSTVPWEARWPQMASLSSFRALAVALLAVVFFVMRDSVQLPVVGPLFRDAIFWLGLVSLLGLALHEEPLHAGLSLMVFLGAFQLLLLSLTQRQMIVGLAMAGQLVLGLAISYLVLSRGLALPEAADPYQAEGGR